jgi:hypothetical protein
MISFELTAQDLSENSYYKLAKGQPFKFTFKGIGGILQYLDTNIIIEDSVGIKDSYIIHNNRKEIVVCDFVDGGGKYQIHSFHLFNASSLRKHKDSLLYFDSVGSLQSPYAALIPFNQKGLVFDDSSTLSLSYSKMLKIYGKPNVISKNGLYKTVIYNFGKRKAYKFLYYRDDSYYKFLFYNNKLISVYITCIDE